MILLQALLLAQPFDLPQSKAMAPKAAAPSAISSTPTFTPTTSSSNEKTTILIQAKARADDLVQAFEMFKKEKPTFRIAARLSNGSTLSDILELTAMPNGTLFIAKTSTSMGQKSQIISVDDIVDFYFP